MSPSDCKQDFFQNNTQFRHVGDSAIAETLTRQASFLMIALQTSRSSSVSRSTNFLFMGNLLVLRSFPTYAVITNPNLKA